MRDSPCSDLGAYRAQAWRLLVAQLGIVFFPLLVGAVASPNAFALPTDIMAGTDLSTHRWSTENGLPQNSVTSIVRSADGYLWLGTFGGLARFDGTVFKTFGVHNTPSVPSNRIVRMTEMDDGSIWMAHQDQGITRWQDGQLTPVSAIPSLPVYALGRIGPNKLLCGHYGGNTLLDTSTQKPLPFESPTGDAPIQVIHLDDQGTIWLATSRKIFRRPVGSKRWILHASLGGRDGEISALYRGTDHILWVGTGAGLWAFPDDTTSAEGAVFAATLSAKNPDVAGVSSPMVGGPHLFYRMIGRVRSFLAHDGTVYAGGEGGIISIDEFDPLQMDHYTAFRHPKYQDLTSARSVRALSGDLSGNLWVGTDGGGLLRIRPKRVHRRRRVAAESIQTITAVTGDRDGGLWFAQQCGRLWHQSEGGIRPIGHTAQSFLRCIHALYVDVDGSLWVGHANALSHFRNGRIVSTQRFGIVNEDEVAVITRDQKGVMWVGTDIGLLRLSAEKPRWFGIKDGLVDTSVHTLLVAKNGDVWAGSKKGLSRIRGTEVRSFTHADGLPRGRIRAIHEAPDGAIWVGSYGGGLARVGDKRLTRLNSKHGLSENYVSRILPDASGRWWMLGNRGLYAAYWEDLQAVADGKMKSLNCINLRESDGMTEGNGGGSPAGWAMPSGVLYLPTVDGLASVDPHSFTFDTASPQSDIQRVSVVNGKELRPINGKVVLTPPSKSLDFEVVGLLVGAPEQVYLRHRLVGYESEWSPAHQRRRVSYTNLSPGSYRFQVQSRCRGGEWRRNGSELQVVVEAAWWQTKSAAAAAFVGFCVFVWLIMSLWSQRHRRMRDQLEATVAKRTAELAYATEEAKTLASTAAQANRAKSDFLAWMSHELRTPLIAVVGFTELLRPTVSQSSTQREHIDAIATSGAHLLDLINDLLDLAMIENRTLVVGYRPTALFKLINGTVEMLRETATRKGLVLTLRMAEDAPPYVSTDPKRLRQVLLNVIGNAVKFTQTGEVTVHVDWVEMASTSSDTEGGQWALRIVVTDTGVGIPTQDLETVYKRFHRASSEMPGTGLGLSICRQLVELLGGEMKLTSTEGQGTVVTLDLPMSLASALDAVDSTEEGDATTTAVAPGSAVSGLPSQPNSDIASDASVPQVTDSGDAQATTLTHAHVGSKVLVVDDIALNRLLITRILEGHGFLVQEADSGEAAIESAIEWQPDLICMDLRMPGMGGMEAALRLRNMGADALILALTATALLAEQDDDGELPIFDGVLAKPFLIKPFLALVTRLMNNKCNESASTVMNSASSSRG